MSDSLRPYGLYSSLPAEPQGKPKNTGEGSQSPLQGSSQPRDQTQGSRIADRFFTSWAIREAQRFGEVAPRFELGFLDSKSRVWEAVYLLQPQHQLLVSNLLFFLILYMPQEKNPPLPSRILGEIPTRK